MGEPTTPAAPPAAEPLIPKPRFDALNERMKAAEAEAAELRKQLATARSSTPPASAAAPEPDVVDERVQNAPPAAPPSIDPAYVQRLELQAKHGVPESALDAVQALVQKGYQVEDAVTVTKAKHPGMFTGATRQTNQPTHTASPPASGRPPAPPPEPDRKEILRAIPNLQQRQRESVSEAGKQIMDFIRSRGARS